MKRFRAFLVEIHDELSKHYTKYNDDERYALATHSSVTDTEEFHVWNSDGELHKALDSATKRHKAPFDFHVYRGHKPGKHIEHTGEHFVSTSTSKSVALSFAKDHKSLLRYKHLTKIHIPKGSHGAYMVGHYSVNGERRPEWHLDAMGEREFLLPKNSKIRTYKKEVDHLRRQVIWHAKLENQ